MSSPRKRSSDLDHRSLLSDSHTPAADIQRYYYQQQMKDERKRSAGSNGSGNTHKKSSRDNVKDQLLHLKCKKMSISNS
jgi:hypothetical protein